MARIIAIYHVIEKGLSMPKTRTGFGSAIALDLIKYIEQYSKLKYDLNNKHIHSAYKILSTYYKNLESNSQHAFMIQSFLSKKPAEQANIDGGCTEVKREYIISQLNQGFEKLANVRHSIRNFSNKDVPLSIIKKAITIAQRSPSVCNRQATRVHLIQEPDILKSILELQNGNRGFGHLINKLFIISTDIAFFDGAGERNQSFVDAGMFAMSLIHALLDMEIGSIPLNWAVEKSRDIQLRNLIGIPPNENIVMLIGIGYLKETTKITVSLRNDLESILSIS
ncbi:MAG: nitroreductase family protein [Candidatus Marinimicrobia bacterium]|nr:nitroreductase family protein [Candidatus Neomarinimicrobiota bacterium]